LFIFYGHVYCLSSQHIVSRLTAATLIILLWRAFLYLENCCNQWADTVGARNECRWCKSDKLNDQGTMSRSPPSASPVLETRRRPTCDPGTRGPNLTLGLGRVRHWDHVTSDNSHNTTIKSIQTTDGPVYAAAVAKCVGADTDTDTEPFSDGARAPLNSTDGTRASSVAVAAIDHTYRNDSSVVGSWRCNLQYVRIIIVIVLLPSAAFSDANIRNPHSVFRRIQYTIII